MPIVPIGFPQCPPRSGTHSAAIRAIASTAQAAGPGGQGKGGQSRGRLPNPNTRLSNSAPCAALLDRYLEACEAAGGLVAPDPYELHEGAEVRDGQQTVSDGGLLANCGGVF